MSERLELPRAVADALLRHARAEFPNEACGLLGGDRATAEVRHYHPSRNGAASSFAYSVHPDDLVRIVFGIEAMGDDLVAIFHSHPHTPAVPSLTDRRQARYPGVFHVVATLSDRDAGPAAALRAWQIVDAESREVEVTLT